MEDGSVIECLIRLCSDGHHSSRWKRLKYGCAEYVIPCETLSTRENVRDLANQMTFILSRNKTRAADWRLVPLSSTLLAVAPALYDTAAVLEIAFTCDSAVSRKFI